MPSIYIREGPLEGKSIQLDPRRQLVLGRDKKTDIHVPDRKLSRRHCSFEKIRDGIMISDLKSTNGTFVNGQRVKDKLLEDGDVIKIGQTEMEFKASGGGAEVVVSGIDAKSSRIRFCSNCGVSIPSRDLDSGRAREAGPRLYCRTCALKHAGGRPLGSRAPERGKKGFVPSYATRADGRTDGEIPLSQKDIESLLGKAPNAAADEEEMMRSLVSRAIRGRGHQQALNVIVKQKITNIDPKDLAALSGLRLSDVERVLADWKEAGIVRSFPGAPYQLAPGRSDAEALKTFVRLWAQGPWRSRLLDWIRAEEAKEEAS